MKTWMVFHPGEGYSTDWKFSDVEEYDTFNAALHAFDRLPDSYYPCAYPPDADDREGTEAEGWIFFYDPRTEDGAQIDTDSEDYDENTDLVDVYPDRIARYGPRAGVRWEHA